LLHARSFWPTRGTLASNAASTGWFILTLRFAVKFVLLLLLLLLHVAAVAANSLEELFGSSTVCRRPLLAAALMVKDEVLTMPTTVRSLASAGIKRLFVYDTGSTDGTQALLRTLTRENGIEFFLKEGEFVDFAVSRNVLLEYATGGSDWLMLFDAGEELEISDYDGSKSIEQVLLSTPAGVCGFHMIQKWGLTTFHNVRLIRNTGIWRYVFPVHEYLTTERATPHECREFHWDQIDFTAAPVVFITQNRALSGVSSPKRWLRDAQVLQAVLDKDPTEPRASFYLAQTYDCLDDCEKSIEASRVRYAVKHRGWWEEREVSAIRIVRCLVLLRRMAEALEWALRLLYDHNRIEGLLNVAHESDAPLCFALMTLACKSKATPQRYLFFEAHKYEVERWQMFDRCKKQVFEHADDDF
jgi:hypothetical protein